MPQPPSATGSLDPIQLENYDSALLPTDVSTIFFGIKHLILSTAHPRPRL